SAPALLRLADDRSVVFPIFPGPRELRRPAAAIRALQEPWHDARHPDGPRQHRGWPAADRAARLLSFGRGLDPFPGERLRDPCSGLQPVAEAAHAASAPAAQ